MTASFLTAPTPVRDHLDDALCREVVQGLSSHAHPALRRVHVSVLCNRVTLVGKVPTYYLKQLAQTLALSAEGVEQIENEIVVV